MRAFIAINLPQDIKDILKILVKDLEKKNRGAKIKWMEGDNFHLTLHFLDEIDDNQAGIIYTELQKISVEYHKFTATLGELGAFPNMQNPRVIFIGVHSDYNQTIEKIQKKIGYELKQSGLEVDLRPYAAHITLGRVKSGQVELDTPLPAGKFQVNSIELMKSTLLPQGAIYEVVKSVELQ